MTLPLRPSYRLLVLLFAAAALLPAQTAAPLAGSVRIVSGTQSADVRTATLGVRRFVALPDVAAMLSLRYAENATLRKAELRLDSAILKFTADNPFVMQMNPATRRYKVYQLSHPVLVLDGVTYASSAELIALLNTLSAARLVIEDRPAPPPTVEPAVTGVEVEEKKNGTLVRIRLSAPVPDPSRVQSGDWIYVTLPAATGDTLALDSSFAAGPVRRVKPVMTETALQLSINLRGRIAASELVQDQTSDDLLLTLVPPAPEEKRPVNADSVRRVQAAERSRLETARQIKAQKNKWKLDVVVIDPGHGGHDPGALGVIGTREKDVTLGVALKLGSLIHKYMPGVKTVYTRSTDRFVELFKRGQIANEAGGKLFISIHCNSTERKPSSAAGFEIYLLRPGKTEDAIRIAEKENEVVKLEKDYEDRYQKLNEENFIILTMAQSAYVKQSERFAELLEETMSAGMEGQRQPVRQAGFYVLVGASMPNVLVETGYLSNPKEEKFLRSPSGQQKIAEAILKALQRFKVEYEENID